MKNINFITIALLFSLNLNYSLANQRDKKISCKSLLVNSALKPVSFNFKGLQVAHVIDPTGSTGATLFYFPEGALANFDSRGGSVASIETTLLEEGSYSNSIDGILFAGGSTMGLAATDGVRKRIFDERAQEASEFDFIPSVPGAVVYDYSGRTHPKMNSLVYPSSALGEELMDNLSSDTFYVGRTGAGLNTTSSKVSKPIWGGQGFNFREYKGGLKIVVATIVNSMGNIVLSDGRLLNQVLDQNQGSELLNNIKNKAGQNTTLSIIITNARLDRNALKRIAVMVHTSMAAVIRPFHSPSDGDILFAVSVPDDDVKVVAEELETHIAIAASEMMATAVIEAGVVSNTEN